jgi:hypothetical protein
VQKNVFLGLILALSAVGSALAQTADVAKFYKLDYVVKEVEGGKTINSRAYSTMLGVSVPGGERPQSQIRAGGRVAVTAQGSNFSFYDVGVNLDSRDLKETQGEVTLFINADVSTLMEGTAGLPPVVRQNKWSGAAIVPLKKPTVVFSSDDVSSKRQLQLELTATPLK